MPIDSNHQKVVEDSFKAMQAGPAGEAAMLALFADNAVFIEPYTGQRRTHNGKEAIRATFKEMWSRPGPPVTLSMGRLDVEGKSLKAEWTCTSPVFPKPMKGYNLFTIGADQKIARMEVFITDAPPMPR
jgi:hypothetical protein